MGASAKESQALLPKQQQQQQQQLAERHVAENEQVAEFGLEVICDEFDAESKATNCIGGGSTQEESPAPSAPAHSLVGMALVALSAFCFSLMSTLLKFASFSISSMEVIFWRSLVALVLNLVAANYYHVSLHVQPADRMNLVYRSLAGFMSISLGFYAMSQMVLADASCIIFTSPVITFFLGALLLGEHIDWISLGFACFSFAGIVCVVRPVFLFGEEVVPVPATDAAGMSHSVTTWVSVLCAFGGAVGQGFVFVCVRKLQQVHFCVIVHYFMLFSTLGSLLVILLIQGHLTLNMSSHLWIAVVSTGVFTFFGQLFLTRGFQLEKAGVASVMRYLDVVFVFLWDSLLLREHISHWSVLGAIIICSSAIVIALRKHTTRSK